MFSLLELKVCLCLGLSTIYYCSEGTATTTGVTTSLRKLSSGSISSLRCSNSCGIICLSGVVKGPRKTLLHFVLFPILKVHFSMCASLSMCHSSFLGGPWYDTVDVSVSTRIRGRYRTLHYAAQILCFMELEAVPGDYCMFGWRTCV